MAPIQFGILLIPFQAIDVVGPLDILSSCSKATIAPMEAAGLPSYAGLTDKAIDIRFHHISTTLDPVELFTAGMKVLPTTTFDTCPPLDILLIGGPDPLTFKLDERIASYVRAHVEARKTLFTICTGAMAIAPTGLLDGKSATTNHGGVDLAKQQYPQVKWTKDKQWVVDGNIWTAGGALAGMDMISAWVTKNYGMEVAKMAFDILDFEPRDVDGNQTLPRQDDVATV